MIEYGYNVKPEQVLEINRKLYKEVSVGTEVLDKLISELSDVFGLHKKGANRFDRMIFTLKAITLANCSMGESYTSNIMSKVSKLSYAEINNHHIDFHKIRCLLSVAWKLQTELEFYLIEQNLKISTNVFEELINRKCLVENGFIERALANGAMQSDELFKPDYSQGINKTKNKNKKSS